MSDEGDDNVVDKKEEDEEEKDLRVLRVNLLCSCQVFPSLMITPAASWAKILSK